MKVEKGTVKLKGKITIRKLDKLGNVLEEDHVDNLVVNAGKAAIAGLIIGTGTAFGYIAIGTGTIAESATDTAMQAQIARKAATTSQVTTTVTNDTARFEATFSSADGLTGQSAVTEYGIFNDPTAGTMLSHAIKAEKNMDWNAGEQLQVIWDVQIQ